MIELRRFMVEIAEFRQKIRDLAPCTLHLAENRRVSARNRAGTGGNRPETGEWCGARDLPPTTTIITSTMIDSTQAAIAEERNH